MGFITKKDLSYWLIILVIINIVISSKYWGSDGKLLEEMSFACTITSLILSVIAIIYSFIQTVSSNSTNDSLKKSAEVLSEAVGEVQKASNSLISIDKISENLNIVTREISKVKDEISYVRNETAAGFNWVLEKMDDTENIKLSHELDDSDKNLVAELLVDKFPGVRQLIYYLLVCYQREHTFAVRTFVKELCAEKEKKENFEDMYAGLYITFIKFLNEIDLVKTSQANGGRVDMFADELKMAIEKAYATKHDEYDKLIDRCINQPTV